MENMQSWPKKQISSIAKYNLHTSHVTYWILQSNTLALLQEPTLLLSLSCLNLRGFQSTCNPGWSYPAHLPIPSPCLRNLGNKHICTCGKELQILLMVTTAITDVWEQLEKKPPWRFQEAKAPRFQDNRHKKVVRLSAQCTGCLYPPVNIPGTHFC
jgi:hypothetical protein